MRRTRRQPPDDDPDKAAERLRQFELERGLEPDEHDPDRPDTPPTEPPARGGRR